MKLFQHKFNTIFQPNVEKHLVLLDEEMQENKISCCASFGLMYLLSLTKYQLCFLSFLKEKIFHHKFILKVLLISHCQLTWHLLCMNK